MSTTNKTPNIGLNQWIGTDKVRREDFNADNAIIDYEINRIDTALAKMAMGSYYFIPALVGTAVAGNHNYAQRGGLCERIGNIVTCSAQISLSGRDANMAGTAILTGLPFASTSYAPVTFSYQNNIGVPGPLSGYVQSNHIVLGYVNNGIFEFLQSENVGNLVLMFSATYII